MKITIKNLQKKIPVSPKRVRDAVHKALKSERCKKPVALSIFFVSDSVIRRLNKKYLKKDAATDVICFDLSDCSRVLVGDIVISSARACVNARIFKTDPIYELYLYVVHGVLHLLGYDDDTDRKRTLMNNKAERILKCLSIRPKQ